MSDTDDVHILYSWGQDRKSKSWTLPGKLLYK